MISEEKFHFHPLPASFEVPEAMVDPFADEPHSAAKEAMRLLREQLPEPEEGAEGKMLGVLVVSDERGRTGYLAAYSGQVAPDSPIGMHERLFVPAVFDYLKPDGTFKREEAEISKITDFIETIRSSEDYVSAVDELRKMETEATEACRRKGAEMQLAKRLRDRRRMEGPLSADEQQELTRESQFLKAELRRTRKRYDERLAPLRARVDELNSQIDSLKLERKTRSDRLQRWLFSQFQMLNKRGERQSLIEIFEAQTGGLPPAGAGECCEPKLLQAAFSQGLRPLAMASAWWGPSPRDEIRHDGHFYPPCSGKCKPLLAYMLGAFPSAESDGSHDEAAGLNVVFEDDCLAVVHKPAGMLSVPGKSDRPSVSSILRARWPEADGPLMVHRLDMATSGLMVVAKTKRIHKDLQAQFSDHRVEKQYIAELSAPCRKLAVGAKCTINLPLSPDYTDRPRQRVDRVRGKEAKTEVELVGPTRVLLKPLTGRTHQLRVHCAHRDGLADPIKGDALYGQRADRLYLQAFRLSFDHPVSGHRMTFSIDPEF